jgi:HSP20 family molecular chaperone IbpA
MNTDEDKTTRTTKKSTTVIVGVITLAIGVLVGLAVTKSRAGNPATGATAKIPTNQMSSVASPGLNPAGQMEWNPFEEIRDMQLQMDQMFNQMSAQFRMEPRLNFFKENPGFSFSLNVQDLKDRFEVRAFLPDAKASDVNVSLQNNQTLKVEVSNKNTEKSDKSANTSVTEWGQYEQTIQLPAPVKTDQLKIDRQGHKLLITIPKA